MIVLDFVRISVLKFFSLPFYRETCGVGKNLSLWTFDFRSYKSKKLKFQCPGLIVTGTPSGSVER